MIAAKPFKHCVYCGDPFKAYRTMDKFCSPKCAVDYGREKGRRAKIYREPATRPVAKRAARQRDGNVCRLASSDLLLPEHRHDRHRLRLEVHHIIFLSEGVYDEDWNLITLCHECHQTLAHGHKATYQWRLLKLVNGTDWTFIYERHPELKPKLGYLLTVATENMLR